MDFVKYHGLGNDFIFVEDGQEKLVLEGPKLAKSLCHRNFGIGADGLVFITGGPALYTMRIFNPDGTEAEMCGNAIRCMADYLLENNLASGPLLQIGTRGGIKEIRVEQDMYVVDMGEPDFSFNEGQPLRLSVAGKEWAVHPVSMGNPHGVVFVEDLDALDIAVWGPLLENHTAWPQKANIEFVKVLAPAHLQARVWERGAGPTLACGTGASAAVVAAHRAGLSNRLAKVDLPGGELVIDWSANGRVLMTGPATKVYKGVIDI